MDDLITQLLQALGIGGGGAGGYAFWQNMKLKEQIDSQKEELQKHKVHVAENYVTHKVLEDLKSDIREIKGDIKELIKTKD